MSDQDKNTNFQKHKILAQNPNIEGMASVGDILLVRTSFLSTVLHLPADFTFPHSDTIPQIQQLNKQKTM